MSEAVKSLAVVNGNGAALAARQADGFEPTSIGEAVQLAKILVAGKLLPRAVQSPEAAFTILMTGRELGLSPMQSLRSIHVIEGKPTLSADLIVALVKKRSDVCQFFRLVESTEKVATYETQRVGEPSPTRMSFSIAEAERAGVAGKDNWRKFPAAMLRARCSAALARAVYPDLAMGLYDPDELERATPVHAGAVQVLAPSDTPTIEEQSEPPVVDWSAAAERIRSAFDSATSKGEVNEAAAEAMDAKRAGMPQPMLDGLKAASERAKARIAAAVQSIEREPGDDSDVEPRGAA